jgi:hypothetical protein
MASAPSNSKVVNSAFIRNFVSAGSSSMKEITEDLSNNLELQGIIKNVIAEYKKMQLAATQSGATLSGIVTEQISARKRNAAELKGDKQDDEPKVTKPRIDIDASITLRRGQLVFGKWVPKLCKELITFADEKVDVQSINVLSAECLSEALEVAFGLVCFGDKLDRVGNPNKKILFTSLKIAYERLGYPLRAIQIDMEKGVADWSSVAKVKLAFQDLEWELSMWDDMKGTWQVVPISSALLGEDSQDFALKLLRPYALTSAFLMATSGNTFPVTTFFVGRCSRRLKRRASEELKAAMTLTSDEALRLSIKLKQQAKAKAKPMGLRSMASSSVPVVTPKAGSMVQTTLPSLVPALIGADPLVTSAASASSAAASVVDLEARTAPSDVAPLFHGADDEEPSVPPTPP